MIPTSLDVFASPERPRLDDTIGCARQVNSLLEVGRLFAAWSAHLTLAVGQRSEASARMAALVDCTSSTRPLSMRNAVR